MDMTQEGISKFESEGTSIMKGAQYHNPDAFFRLIGQQNITEVLVNGIHTKGLLAGGSQITTVTEPFAHKLKLKIEPICKLGAKLEIEGSGRTKVPYIDYVSISLQIETLKDHSFQQTALVVPDSDFGKIVPLQIGTLVQEEILVKVPWKTLETLGSEIKRWVLCGKLSRNP